MVIFDFVSVLRFTSFSSFFFRSLQRQDQLHLHTSGSPLKKDHPCQVWINLVDQFCKRRLKNYWTTDKREVIAKIHITIGPVSSKCCDKLSFQCKEDGILHTYESISSWGHREGAGGHFDFWWGCTIAVKKAVYIFLLQVFMPKT